MYGLGMAFGEVILALPPVCVPTMSSGTGAPVAWRHTLPMGCGWLSLGRFWATLGRVCKRGAWGGCQGWTLPAQLTLVGGSHVWQPGDGARCWGAAHSCVGQIGSPC